MAYTRGNLAVQPKRKEEVNPLPREDKSSYQTKSTSAARETFVYADARSMRFGGYHPDFTLRSYL